jgi:hypothetical protein
MVLFNRNIIKYQFKSLQYNEQYIAEEVIKRVIVKSIPSSSCWWSKLKQRTDKAKNNIEAVKHSQQNLLKGVGNDTTKGVTAKTCSGILNLFNKTYLIKSPTDIVITIDSDEEYRWDVGNAELVTISAHNKTQFCNEGNDLFSNKMCFKISLQLRLSTRDFGYMLTTPYYHNELGLDMALGYVSEMYAKSEGLNLFMFMEKPKDGTKTLTIPEGTVLQYLIPDVKSSLVYENKRFIASLLDNRFNTKRKRT